MRFGLRLVQFSGDVREMGAWAVAAEKAGFDQLWYGQDSFMIDARAMAVMLAEKTSRIQIGPMVGPFDSDPAGLAVYLGTLDAISGGRALLSIGMHGDAQCRWTGNDPATGCTRTREIVRLLRTLLAGENAATNGPYYYWTEECHLRFEPVRRNVPIYIAGHEPELFALAGEIGDGSLPPLYPPEAAAVVVPEIVAGVERAGRSLVDVDIAGCVWLSLTEDGSRAAEPLRRLVSYFGPQLSAALIGTIGLVPDDFGEIGRLVATGAIGEAERLVTDQMLRLALVGTPEEVISRIERLSEVGVTQINVGGPLGPDPLAAIHLMGEKVIPAFRS